MIHWCPEGTYPHIGLNFSITRTYFRCFWFWYQPATYECTSFYFRLRWKHWAVFGEKKKWNVIYNYVSVHNLVLLSRTVADDYHVKKEDTIARVKEIW